MKKLELHVQTVAVHLEQTGRYGMQKHLVQHGCSSVYDHCVQVATLSCAIAVKLHWAVNRNALIRGALLHDYFLYDWHDKNHGHAWHGISHPQTALSNAEQDYGLNQVERDIIRRHMFPLTLCPPVTREGWIVCLADKICALQETFSRERTAAFVGKIRIFWKWCLQALG